MTTAEHFRLATILIRRASEAGLITGVNLGGGARHIALLEPIKDNTRYPTKVCEYTTVEECLAFLDARRAMQKPPSCG